MGQITKEFAQSLLKRIDAGQHINTTLGEEQQLVTAWLYWHEHVYKPRMEALLKHSAADATGPMAGSSSGSLTGSNS